MRKSIFIPLLASAAISTAAFAAGEPQSDQHRWQRSAQSSNSDESPRAERGASARSRETMTVQSPSSEPRMRPERSNWAGRGGGEISGQQSVTPDAARSRGDFDARLEAYRQARQRGGMTGGSWGDRGTPVTGTTTETVRDHRYGGDTRNWSGRTGSTTPTARTDRYSGGTRSWSSTDWRRDNRYDWNRYRDRHRSTFRLGIYLDPYGYNYQRYDVGYRLSPYYYSSNYWLEDPWMYRLPPVYGPYRWVRYWDDALLVDIYSGQVVDVIHDFFW